MKERGQSPVTEFSEMDGNDSVSVSKMEALEQLIGDVNDRELVRLEYSAMLSLDIDFIKFISFGENARILAMALPDNILLAEVKRRHLDDKI